MNEYITMTDEDAEANIFNRLHRYDAEEKTRYSSVGIMCAEVDRRLLWKQRLDADGMPCASFGRWLRACCPYSYSTCYAAMRDVQALQDVPANDLLEIPQSNIATMKQLSTAVRRDSRVLEAAKTQRTEEFVATIRREHPNQHLEHNKPLKLSPREHQRADIDEAISRAKAGEDISDTEAIWRICVDYNLGHQDSPIDLATMATQVVQ